MAARRLLIILVLLLAASIVAAALAPDRTSRILPDESSTTSTTSTAPEAETTGETRTVSIDASAAKPETVRVVVGDQLALDVGVPAEPGRAISIDEFGVTDFAAPEAPAHFDLLLRDPGDFAITDERGTVVGRLQVKEPAAAGAAADRGPPADT